MKCPRCKKNRVVRDSRLGILPCEKCQQEENKYAKPHHNPEFTTDSIRDQRREFSKDIIQPFDGEGFVSKEYLENYGTSGIEVTDKQIKNSRYTMKGRPGWWNRNKSKGGRPTKWVEKNVPKEMRK